MKLRLLFILFLATASMAAAQEVSISGAVASSEGERGAYATVSLLQASDSSLVGAVVTKDDGTFNLNAQAGTYILSVSSVGYEKYYQELSLQKSEQLGTITIQHSHVALDGVDVVHKKPTIVAKSDRLIFHVEGTAEAEASNSVYDLLEKMPGVIIDRANRSISIVGKGTVNVLVNGRMLNLDGDALASYLSSLSPSQLSSIELITTPPARYDAEGNAGLLNIKLKTVPKDYLGGNVRAFYKKREEGQDYGGSYALNFNKGKWSLSNSANFYKFNIIGDASIAQELEESHKYDSHLDTESDMDDIGVNFGVDFQASEKVVLGARYNYIHSKTEGLNQGIQHNYDYVLGNYELDNNSEDYNDKNLKGNTHNVMLYSDINLDTLGSVLSITAGAVINDADGDGGLRTDALYTDGSTSSSIMDYNQVSSRDIYTAGIDWTKVCSFANISLGAKLTFSQSADTYLEYLNNATDFNANTSGKFKYDEDIQAVYADFSKHLDRWDFRAGLRAENTITKSNELLLDSINKNDYFKLFPTVSVSYTDKKENSFALNYNRRLNRPWMWALNPARTYVGNSAVMTGNPFLKPMIGDYLSFRYARSKFSFTLGANFEKDMFSSNTNYYDPTEDIFIIGRYNNFKQQSFYTNFNYQFDVFDWWSSYNLLSATNFKNDNTDDRFDIDTKEGYSIYLSTNNTFYPLAGESRNKLSLSLNFWYSPKSDGGREIMMASSDLSFGVNWIPIQDKLSVSLWLSDIFAEQESGIETWENEVHTKMMEYRDTRSLQISLKYKFGGNIRSKYKGVNQEEMNRL